MSNEKVFYCAVRYADMKTEIVQSTSIKHFSPGDYLDFDPEKIYKVKTTSWNVSRKLEVYEAIIEGIGGKFNSVNVCIHITLRIRTGKCSVL